MSDKKLRFPTPNVSLKFTNQEHDIINEYIDKIPGYDANLSNNKLLVLCLTEVVDRAREKFDFETLQNSFEELAIKMQTVSEQKHELEHEVQTLLEKNKELELLLEEKNNQAPEIIEKPITVEKPLAENQVLVNFTPVQLQVVEKINQNRFERKAEKTQLTPEELILKVLFSRWFLFNYSGEFPTYLQDLPKQD
jgi:chromosome condensin MukBEF ATPase and DNA-binding subunit MukB